MAEKIGVYVCHCGSNIADAVDVEGVARFAAMLRGVAVSRHDRFVCSQPGQELIERDIQELGLTGVVVAACSPQLHEPTFRRACGRAGLNPYLMEMANIREQCSWVTLDPAAATEKAKALVAGAVHRVACQQALEPHRVSIHPRTLVVGGGIAGIQAALELADAGYPVTLVEREPSIGGHMAQLDKTFPTLDCSACILTPKMMAVGQHPNIQLLSYSEVEGLSGYVGNFVVRIRKKARYVAEDKCTGCEICQQKCPVWVEDEVFEAGLGFRKAIYSPFAQAVPNTPVIDREACVYFERGKCKACEIFCPAEAIIWDQEDEVLDIEVGNIVLATGYRLFDPRRIPQYGYGRLENVFTSLEFERMCNAAGPTAGRIVLRDGMTQPQRVAIVHCVGSRDRNYNAYCSDVCCMYSLKFAHLVHERLPEAEVYNFYIDIRSSRKGYEEFYHRLLDEGTHFIRGKVARISDVPETPKEEGRLIVEAEDTLIGRQRRLPVDMVILSCGLEPQADVREVARRFGISCSHNGFFIERHPKLDPVATMTDGVFIAGACQGPQDIQSAVAQGAAAAARVAGLISRGEVELEPVLAAVDEAACNGCAECLSVCPYSAIELLEDRDKAHVIAALCKGCGVCAAACLPKAISLSHYTDEQLVAQAKGLLNV
ncbi:MAG: CoB--CoM heterodisulfide reductase iron-sulfur subunit A family protein [Gemmatimonadota bacterium]|nr:MAG: CoB--CoM heterodisulfide reductase iron-sulfur subunit A family protein [Gemmatimonadota bacterium]